MENKTTQASSVRQKIIEYPGNLSAFTQIIEQARVSDSQEKEKSLATHMEITYNYSK